MNSLNDLSTIFKDLQNVILAQGTILDRIDFNIDTAALNVEKANKHLKKADEALKKSCYVKCDIDNLEGIDKLLESFTKAEPVIFINN